MRLKPTQSRNIFKITSELRNQDLEAIAKGNLSWKMFRWWTHRVRFRVHAVRRATSIPATPLTWIKINGDIQSLQREFDSLLKTALEQINDLRPAFIQIGREFYKANKAIFKLKGPGQYADFTGPRICPNLEESGPTRQTRSWWQSYSLPARKAEGDRTSEGYLYWSFPVQLLKALWPTKPTVKPWTSSPRIRSRSERPLVTRLSPVRHQKNADATNPFHWSKHNGLGILPMCSAEETKLGRWQSKDTFFVL